MLTVGLGIDGMQSPSYRPQTHNDPRTPLQAEVHDVLFLFFFLSFVVSIPGRFLLTSADTE